jgi:hypothetical protein
MSESEFFECCTRCDSESTRKIVNWGVFASVWGIYAVSSALLGQVPVQITNWGILVWWLLFVPALVVYVGLWYVCSTISDKRDEHLARTHGLICPSCKANLWKICREKDKDFENAPSGTDYYRRTIKGSGQCRNCGFSIWLPSSESWNKRHGQQRPAVNKQLEELQAQYRQMTNGDK